MDRPDRIEIPVGEAETVVDLHRLVHAALAFPEYYGPNWDAMYDALTHAGRLPRRLVLTGWDRFEARLPGAAAMLLRVLADLETEFPDLACTVERA